MSRLRASPLLIAELSAPGIDQIGTVPIVLVVERLRAAGWVISSSEFVVPLGTIPPATEKNAGLKPNAFASSSHE